MDILMVTAELAPYVRSSATGDSVAALSRALTQTGHRVTVALPLFEGIEQSGLMVARRLSQLTLPGAEPVTVYDGQLPSGVGLVLFEFSNLPPRTNAYDEDGKDHPDSLARFTMLGRAASALCEQRAQQGKPFEVLHAHDWPGATLSLITTPVPMLLTVHDAGRQGSFPWKEIDALGLELDPDQRERLRFGSRANLLKAGMMAAKVVTTVSPSTALELKAPEHFGAFASALGEAEIEIQGVLGGVDYSIYNPATDTALASRYDAECPERKGNSKTALCRALELDLEPERPLVVYAGDLDKDAGADLLPPVLLELAKRDVLVVVVGSGSARALSRQFVSAKMKRFESYRFIENDTPAERRRVLAAADIALFPSRAHHSGHAVRVAQRYGAVPVALAVSGNRDAIVDCDTELRTGTGFLFEDATSEALLASVERALAGTKTPNWGKLRRRILRLDLGWEGPARRYAQLYRIALKS
jgi:starch synthase